MKDDELLQELFTTKERINEIRRFTLRLLDEILKLDSEYYYRIKDYLIKTDEET